jgi:FG-GAP repeat
MQRIAAAQRALVVMAGTSACVITTDHGPVLDETGGGPEGMAPSTIEDGQGEGTFRLPLLGERFSLLIGAPLAELDGAERAGIVSVFASEPGQGVVIPPLFYANLFEDGTSSLCPDPEHHFAREHAANRSFGRSLSWYSENLGADYLAYENTPIISAPRASDSNGMVGQYRRYCFSCASFASSPGSLALEGDELGTVYGASLGVGVFELANVATPHLWRLNSSEFLAVGAPSWNGNGGVHIYDPSSYRHWFVLAGENEELSGTRICDRDAGGGPLVPRLRTLAGGFPTEEFGRSMAVADFSCDGYDDLAIGAPGADLPVGDGQVIEDAGAVYIFRGGPLGIGMEGSLVFTQGAFGSEGTPESGDRFGEILTVGTFNGRRVETTVPWSCWSLAVGTPNEDNARGEVQIFYGDPASLAVVGPILRPGENGLPGARHSEDRFGASLVGYTFDDDGFHDLAIGAPGDAGGRVHLIPGSITGLDLAHGASFVQETLAIPDDNDSNDQLGGAVGAMFSEYDTALVVGVPGEDMGQGAVVMLKVEVDPMTSVFVAIGTATIFRPADAGLSLSAQAHWGEVIGPPRAFPAQPVEF